MSRQGKVELTGRFTERSLSRVMSELGYNVCSYVLTLSKDVHRVVDLNVHVIANSGQFLPFGRHDLAFLRLDLVGR